VAELFQPFLDSSYQIRIGADITLKEKEKKKTSSHLSMAQAVDSQFSPWSVCEFSTVEPLSLTKIDWVHETTHTVMHSIPSFIKYSHAVTLSLCTS